MNSPKPQLSKAEWVCLRAIANSERGLGSERYSIATGVPSCTGTVLNRLRSLGLIESTTGLWLPLEMKREVIRLTAAGKAYLASDSSR